MGTSMMFFGMGYGYAKSKRKKSMKNTSDITHRFFRVRASALDDNQKKVNGIGHVCLVLRPTRTAQTYRVAVSFKSPADKLDRDLGVRIAEGRLTSPRPGRNFRVTAKSLDGAFSAALSTLFTKSRRVMREGKAVSRPFVPDWLHQAVVEQEHQIQALKR